MNKSYIVPVAVIIALIGFIAYNWRVLDPESAIKKECPVTSTNPSCIVRMRALGHLLSGDGIDETVDNLIRAANWYKIAADKDDVESMFHLGWTYWAIAYKLDDSSPPKSFKDMLKNMEEGTQDITPSSEYREKSKQWYAKAAQKGFAPAMNNMGYFYERETDEEGREVATRWAYKSASAGNPMGSALLNWLHKKYSYIDTDSVLTENWKYWNPKNTNPRDLLKPTLERTLWGGWLPDYNTCSKIRQAAKEGTPIVIGW